MANPRVIIVGAGPAGVRAAETFAAAGIRPVVIDEGELSGGQIYRRQPSNFSRTYERLYHSDAAKAKALHSTFDALRERIDYRPRTLAWTLRDQTLHVTTDGISSALAFDVLVLATGATDRLAPVPGWTRPGCYSLGGSQIALKAQACSIGRRPVFAGTGPLLYLVAYQYLKAGVRPVAVLDTSRFSAQVRALPKMLARPGLLLRGMFMRARLQLAGVPIRNGVDELKVSGAKEVEGIEYRTSNGEPKAMVCDAIGMGFHLRPETQLADLAGCPFRFDASTSAWIPEADQDGRTPRTGIYIAGDGARVLGADAAETAGRLAAYAALTDAGTEVDANEIRKLRKLMTTFERFRDGLNIAFPWPSHLVRAVADDVVVCRCESITAGSIREAALAGDAPEMNRAKALSRVGMGRCQGRFCGMAATEILAQARSTPIHMVGRLRGAAPVKPLSMATVKERQP